MPAISTGVSVHATLSLDEKILEQYKKEAQGYGVSLEELLSNRLTACVAYSASKPLYLDDAQRQQIEKLTGRNISQSYALIQIVEKLLSMRISGMSVTLKPDILSRLRTRHNSGDFAQWLEHQIGILLEQFVGLR